MNRDEFYAGINSLINKYDSLSVDDNYEIGYIIRKEVRRRKYANLKQSGPCMLCGKHIKFKFISVAHGTQGDNFLDRLKAKMATFIFKIETDYNHKYYKKIVNYAIKNIEPYFCENCFLTMKIIIESEWPIKKIEPKPKIHKEEYDHERYIKYLIEIFKGCLIDEYDEAVAKRIGFIKHKFILLSHVFTQTDYNLLSSMNYKDFLKTTYWHVIREYILDKYENKCIVCDGIYNLNVHHKTYKHHGIEHEFIEDLTVLCKSCHAKFHDKLDSIEE